MIVYYNSLNRLDPPQFTLCNPGSVYNNGMLTNVIGILPDHEAEEIVFHFNATSELNLRISKVQRQDSEQNEYAMSMYNATQNRRLIYVEDIGYFVITNVKDGNENGISYKDITAQSADVEIQQKMIPYIENGTYRFTTDQEGNKGILETIVEILPLWTVGYVDPLVAAKWRTFEDVDTSTNCLGFLLQNIQDAYECIVLFNIIDRTINVYDQENYVRKTDIHISNDDLINSLEITENADDLYTALNVLGDDNTTIAAINPLGTNVIYNFDYYLEWMPDNLREKVSLWQNAVREQLDPYYRLNLSYYSEMDQASNLQAEIDRIDIQLTMYHRCRDNIVAESSTSLVDSYNEVIVENGGTPIQSYPEIAETLSEIDALIAECEVARESTVAQFNAINAELTNIHNQIAAIHDSLSVQNYFTEKEYSILSQYIFEGSYKDEYVTITDVMTYKEKFEQMKTMYDRASAQLKKVSEPTREFSIDVENFVFRKEFAHWSEQLETGCLINVEIDKDVVELLFLSSIAINYDDHSLELTFGNRYNKYDPKSLFSGVLGNISKAANTLNYIKNILFPLKNGEFSAMQEALQTSRNLTMGGALSSTNEEVVIDESGYTGKKLNPDGVTYDPHQIKITGRTIVFTDDEWETCKVALGELLMEDGSTIYGLNAQAIFGDLIMGQGLRIVDSEGNELLSVMDGKITMQASKTLSDAKDYADSAAGAAQAAASKELSDYAKEVDERLVQFEVDSEGIKGRIESTEMRVEEVLSDAKDYADQVSGKGPVETIDYYLVSSKNTGITTDPNEGWTQTPPLTSPDQPYLWHYKVEKYQSGQTVTSAPAVIGTHGATGASGQAGTAGKDGKDGADAILLMIDSSGGNIFKNSAIATILSVSIIVGDNILSGARQTKAYFGDSARLIWQEKRMGEDEFTPLDGSDPRLSDEGFLLTLNPQDVETKTVFRCLLDIT